ncbi:hypothetical protein D3C80_1458700 [compost metagenome]
MCLPETRRHFWVSATRGNLTGETPKKISLKGAIPELTNINVGSFFTTNGAEGTILCPLLSKKSKNALRTDLESMKF